MREAAKKFEFERAATIRDRIRLLKQRDLGPLFDPAPTGTAAAPASETPSAVSEKQP